MLNNNILSNLEWLYNARTVLWPWRAHMDDAKSTRCWLALFADAVSSISQSVRLHVSDCCLTGIQSAFVAAHRTPRARYRRSHDTNYRYPATRVQSEVAYITQLLSPPGGIVIRRVCLLVRSFVVFVVISGKEKSQKVRFSSNLVQIFNICAKILLLTFQRSRSTFKVKTAILKLLGRPYGVTVGLIKCSWCFFFFNA